MSGFTINKIIIESIRRSSEVQVADGSFLAGHNGPYHDPETPVRNTAHWVVANLYAWKTTGESKFRDVAIAGVDYLVEAVCASGPNGVVCRQKPGKDKTNGLVGQAWIIEALAEAAWLVGADNALKAAEDLFRRHWFDVRAGAWKTAPEPESGTVRFDRTFNHQLWFAASGALLIRSGVDVRESVENFVNQHVRAMKQYPSGLIHHSDPNFIAVEPKEKVKAFLRHLRLVAASEKVYMKSIGYHTFNTYALALIETSMPDLHLRELEAVKHAVQFIASDEFHENIGGSDYSFPYNPPGFEAAYTLKILSEREHSVSDGLMKEQLKRTFNSESGHFDANVSDARTCAARVYEAARLIECRSQ